MELIQWVQVTSGHDKNTGQKVLEELVVIWVADFDETLAPRLEPGRVDIGDEVVVVDVDLLLDKVLR